MMKLYLKFIICTLSILCACSLGLKDDQSGATITTNTKTGSIRGTVVESDSTILARKVASTTAVADAQVFLLQNGDTLGIDTTNVQGEFAFDSLVAGAYGIYVKSTDGSSALLDSIALSEGDTLQYLLTLGTFATPISLAKIGTLQIQLHMKNPLGDTIPVPNSLISPFIVTKLHYYNCASLERYSDTLYWSAALQAYPWTIDSVALGSYCLELQVDGSTIPIYINTDSSYHVTIQDSTHFRWEAGVYIPNTEFDISTIVGMYLDSFTNFDSVNYQIHGFDLDSAGIMRPVGVHVLTGTLKAFDEFNDTLLIDTASGYLLKHAIGMDFLFRDYSILGRINRSTGDISWTHPPRIDPAQYQFHREDFWITSPTLDSLGEFVMKRDRILTSPSSVYWCTLDTTTDSLAIPVVNIETALSSVTILDTDSIPLVTPLHFAYVVDGDMIYDYPIVGDAVLILDSLTPEICRGHLNTLVDFRLPVKYGKLTP